MIAVRIPEKEGEICVLTTPLKDEDPNDVYIVSEDPAPYRMSDNIYVTNLRDLQRNVGTGRIVPQKAVKKNELSVIADDLAAYVEAWK